VRSDYVYILFNIRYFDRKEFISNIDIKDRLYFRKKDDVVSMIVFNGFVSNDAISRTTVISIEEKSKRISPNSLSFSFSARHERRARRAGV